MTLRGTGPREALAYRNEAVYLHAPQLRSLPYQLTLNVALLKISENVLTRLISLSTNVCKVDDLKFLWGEAES